MLLLGLLLMAATAAFTGLLIAFNLSGGPTYAVSLFGGHPFTISVLGAFLGGLALAILFGLGLWMFLGGTALAAYRGRKRRARRDEVRQTRAERDAMAERLEGGGAPADSRSPAPAPRRPHRLHLPGH
ncbi:hypothetical protein [Streptomyces sp. NPDC047028]|uniref:hypothetical protein n=1 Tax=Streptomyces sp. NPDC047028 TaxID=3155793 RepID=UPI0033FF8608